MEADLLRFYRLDLGDYPARLTFRRLLVCIRWLPRGHQSAVLRAEGVEWSAEADLLDRTYRLLVMVHAERHKDPGPHPDHPVHEAKRRAHEARVPALLAGLARRKAMKRRQREEET